MSFLLSFSLILGCSTYFGSTLKAEAYAQDNGGTGTFEAHYSGSGCAFSANVSIVYTRTKSNGRYYLKLKAISGKVTHVDSGFKCTGVKVKYGQSYYWDSHTKSFNSTYSRFTRDPDWNKVCDDLGAGGTTVGCTATFYFKRGNGKTYELTVVDKVYEQYYVDNGKVKCPVTISIQELTQGRTYRSVKSGR